MTQATPSSANVINECLRRAELYRWFAGLLAGRLDPVLLGAYRQGPGRAVLDNLSADPALAAGARRMEAALDHSGNDKGLAEALARDFRALFEQGAAPPRASAWQAPREEAARSGEADTAERSAPSHKTDILGRMKSLFHHTGLGVRSILPSDPDHLAVLLDVLAQMAEGTLSVWRKAEHDASGETPVADVPALVESCREQRVFIDDNLMSWLPAFREACEVHDPDGFYAGVAALLVAYLERDRSFLARCEGDAGGS